MVVLLGNETLGGPPHPRGDSKRETDPCNTNGVGFPWGGFFIFADLMEPDRIGNSQLLCPICSVSITLHNFLLMP